MPGSVDWWPPEGWVIRFTNLLASTENNSMLDQVSVFPNPAIDKLFVKCESPLQSAAVFNLNGEQHTITLDKEMNEADISALQPGIWFLRLSDGNKIWNTKFIKI
ncbi:MAG: T9SS type A sorting domain-containing protein [Saprospiraceae bacterium]|nr:T9SS type A sorting domain-containing protein [Saprospiraceae bacterium]